MKTRHHNLKSLPCYFQEAVDGNKTFEIRDNNDRAFQKGDTITLWETRVESLGQSTRTGRHVDAVITHVSNYHQREGYVVFSFKVTCDAEEPAQHPH